MYQNEFELLLILCGSRKNMKNFVLILVLSSMLIGCASRSEFNFYKDRLLTAENNLLSTKDELDRVNNKLNSKLNNEIVKLNLREEIVLSLETRLNKFKTELDQREKNLIVKENNFDQYQSKLDQHDELLLIVENKLEVLKEGLLLSATRIDEHTDAIEILDKNDQNIKMILQIAQEITKNFHERIKRLEDEEE